ncbi:MAG: hypothetical protein QG594_1474, partial [Bacteroidota bacterium]|nr:hypothetical protein [Bacteroidota bacterium]
EADVGGFENYPSVARDANWDSDNDGLPNWWETIKGTNTNSASGDFSDSNADVDADGYTNLDNYLQWMDQPHFDTPNGTKLSINIQKLSRGFANGVTYSISNITNGTAVLNADIVEFTPTANGLGSFNFTVTDNTGGTMTRKVNILSGYALNLSTTDFEKNNAKVIIWPVPNKGSFSVLMENDLEAEYKIYDILGREIKKGILTGNRQENIHLQSKGVYVIKISDSNSKEILNIQKIIVE